VCERLLFMLTLHGMMRYKAISVCRWPVKALLAVYIVAVCWTNRKCSSLSFDFYLCPVERLGQAVNTPASYSSGPRFKSRPGDRLSWQVLLCFTSVPPGECQDSTLKSDHGHFFHILSNSSFTYHPFIEQSQKCLTLAFTLPGKAPVNLSSFSLL
jgi:hypothetical protein